MVANIIDGKTFAAKIKTDIAAEIAAKIKQGLPQPSLAVILVGDNPASHIYVRNKRQACYDAGIKSIYHPLPNTVHENELKTLIQQLNNDPTVNGILLQLPLPHIALYNTFSDLLAAGQAAAVLLAT